MFVICVLIDDSHSDSYEVIISLCIWFAFLWWLLMVNIFSCTYLLAVYISSLEKMFVFFCTFLNCLFLMLGHMSFLYMLDINPLLVISFANTLSDLVDCLLRVSFAMQRLLSLIRSHLFIFAFISFTLWRQIQKNVAVIYVKECSTYVFFYGFNDFQSSIQIFLKRDIYFI